MDYICILGGTLMFIASLVGSTVIYAILFGYLTKIFPEYKAFLIIFLIILIFIMMGGGIAVIIGTLLVAKEQHKIGKIII